MIATRKHTRRQISDLKMDLEVINPIESKTLLGGDWYELDTVYVRSGGGWASGAGTFGDTYDPFYDGSSTSDWYNYGENYGGSGGDSAQLTPDDYPGGTSLAEAIWLATHPQHLADMIHNKELADIYGQGQRNGVFDALRHALWSALDTADIGYNDAEEFHTLHETNGLHPWDPIESPSDINNNDWGYVWALNYGDPENNINKFIDDFNKAVANGDISIIP